MRNTLVKARVQDQELTPWAEGQGYARYLAASVKGTAEIDWDEPTAREAFLAEIVADADRDRIVAAAQLLGPLLHQDVDRPATGRTPHTRGEPGPHCVCT